MDNKINWMAILASVVATMVIGFLWYGAIFQNQWMAGNGITANEDSTIMYKNGAEMDMSFTPMIVNVIFMFIYAFIMNWLLNKLNARNLQSGAMVGLAVGVTHLMNIMVGNMFAANPSSLTIVDGSYSIVLFTVMGAIIGAMHKR
ncbi:MAG TPA: DUF1761 domain-containing protein [Saprospiraceae bacterium]|jgi:uncharacterized membrane protein YagU involved in acid resistance|nr:DUF1761 domain-containing protein [Saprospiraceae bacterium]HMT70311.1 DUF1761 domain-containing protein [Saprospiraceae bacterium]